MAEEYYFMGTDQEPDPSFNEDFMFKKFLADQHNRAEEERVREQKKNNLDIAGNLMRGYYARSAYDYNDAFENNGFNDASLKLYGGLNTASAVPEAMLEAVSETITNPETWASLAGRHQLMSFNEGKEPTMLDFVEDCIENTGLGYIPVMAYDHLSGREKVSPTGLGLTIAMAGLPFANKIRKAVGGKFADTLSKKVRERAIEKIGGGSGMGYLK